MFSLPYMNPVYYKCILQGHLDFQNEKSYQKMLEMYQYKMENFFKSEVILKAESCFKEDSLSFIVVRTVVQATKKSFQNTVELCQYIAQFAITGQIGAWMLEEGQILQYHHIEPVSEKAAIQAFIRGRSLSKQKGSEAEAIAALSDAIEKYDKHAQAYERRGYVNVRLGNTKDAMYDFTKSIKLDEGNANAYCGRARIYLQDKKFPEAIQDLIQATSRSLALQPIYWTATRMRGECYLQLKNYDKAIFDLKLFCNRTFQIDDPNFKWKKYGAFLYAQALYGGKDYATALEVLLKLPGFEEPQNPIEENDYWILLAKTKKEMGKSGHLADLKTAIDKGSELAAELLKSWTQ